MDKDFRDILVSPDTSIRETMKVIDEGVMEIALVVNEENRLLGTVTDGDIRRAILKDIGLEEKIKNVMHPNPVTARVSTLKEDLLHLMKSTSLRQIPIVDEEHRVIGIKLLKDLIKEKGKENIVIIMAGGLGNRLKPLTNSIPKPLLKVGKKPLLEIIIEQLESYGLRDIFISVNYKPDLIENYFQDGRQYGVKIRYLKEDKQLGTAGSIRLAKEWIEKPFLVMNGDLLTKVNFDSLLDYHLQNGYSLTMAINRYRFQIPYGVVDLEDTKVKGISEKPSLAFFINAGIYVINPELTKFIPENEYFDMPDLINKVIENKEIIGSFPIREYWLDVGEIEDFKRANHEYDKYFNNTHGE
ncbi:MAG: nucleotidyltransferase family protein [bacterium]|nr:nucleotidyltransferase family protein [bacterium]